MHEVKTQTKLLSKQASSDVNSDKYIDENDNVDKDEDEIRYKKTPKLSRKHVSTRTTTHRELSATPSSQSSSNHNVLNQDTLQNDIDEGDEIAIEQEKQMDTLKKILTS